jgi:serine/threonine protein kinase
LIDQQKEKTTSHNLKQIIRKEEEEMSRSNRRVVATVVPPGHTFTIDPRYQPGKMLGKGSFGVVCTAFDTVTQTTVAIKRIRPFANDEWDARHTLREIRLMKLLGRHPNVKELLKFTLYLLTPLPADYHSL